MKINQKSFYWTKILRKMLWNLFIHLKNISRIRQIFSWIHFSIRFLLRTKTKCKFNNLSFQNGILPTFLKSIRKNWANENPFPIFSIEKSIFNLILSLRLVRKFIKWKFKHFNGNLHPLQILTIFFNNNFNENLLNNVNTCKNN
jgi:hypothetical protein